MRAALALTVLLASGAVHAASRGSYVLCSAGSPGCHMVISGQSSIRTIQAIRARYNGAFLWVRLDGREYLIRDRALLDRADDLFAPLRALEPEQAKVAREERALDHEEERLEKLAGDDETPVRDRMRDLERKQREVEVREKVLDDRQEELERVAENDLWRMVDEAIRNGVAKRE